MKILKESYTQDEIKQRVTDTRNIFEALLSSLFILASACGDAEEDKDTNARLGRYVEEYVETIRKVSSDFYDDFEDYITDGRKWYDIDTGEEEEEDEERDEV